MNNKIWDLSTADVASHVEPVPFCILESDGLWLTTNEVVYESSLLRLENHLVASPGARRWSEKKLSFTACTEVTCSSDPVAAGMYPLLAHAKLLRLKSWFLFRDLFQAVFKKKTLRVVLSVETEQWRKVS